MFPLKKYSVSAPCSHVLNHLAFRLLSRVPMYIQVYVVYAGISFLWSVLPFPVDSGFMLRFRMGS